MNEIKVELEDLSTVKKRMTVTVPSDEVTRALDRAYRKLRATAAVAGFRKGNVPRSVLKARFGEAVSHDVATELIESSYAKALEEKALAPIGRPDMELKTEAPEEGKEFTYTVTFEVTPKIEVKGYKGLELDLAKDTEVSDEEVEKRLGELRDARVEFREVERPAADGDLVSVDFTAERNGKPLKGIKAKDYPVIVGERGPMPGFAEAIRGVKKGEKKDLALAFPENYSEKGLAGKEALFHVTVKAVREKAVPEIDDELAKGFGLESLDDLKEKVRAGLKEEKEKAWKDKVKTAILDKLIEKSSFDVPDTLVERYLALILDNIADNMRAGIISPEDRGLNAEELKEKYRDVAVRRAKEDAVLDSIAEKEKVEVSREEVEKAVKELAASRGVPFDSLMARIVREGTLEMIKDGLKHEKVFDLIIEAAGKAK